MKRWAVIGYLVGLMLGCTTAAVVAQGEGVGGAVGAPEAQVVGPDGAERWFLPNGKASAAMYVRGANAYVGRLEMVPGAGVPEHRDPTEEYIYIVEGGGTISIDDVKTEVGPHTAIYMPAGAKVSYTNGPEPMVAIQVFAGPGPEDKFREWSPEPLEAALR